MTRDELFGGNRSGTFCSVPLILLGVPNTILPAYNLKVWAALSNRLGSNAGSFPGYGRLAQDSGGSRKGAIEAIKELVVMGLVLKGSRKVGDSPLDDSNYYTLMLPGELLELEKQKVVKAGDYLEAFRTVVKRLHHPQSPAFTRVVKRLHQGSEGSTPRVVKALHPNQQKQPTKQPTKGNNESQPTPSLAPREETELSASESSQVGCDEGDSQTLLGIEPSMHKQRFIQLVRLWNKHMGPPPLTTKTITACYKLMGIEEKKTGQTLNPDLIITAARDRGLTFTSLFTASGSSFLWAVIQQAPAPAASPASGEPADARPCTDCPETALTPSVAQPWPEETPEEKKANDAKARQQLGAALRKQKAKKTWPAAEVEAIYAAYPRKVGRGPALVAIEKRLLGLRDNGHEDPYGYLLGRVQLFARSEAGNKGTYTPHCSTWVNQIRDTDDEQEWNPKTEDRSGNIVRVIDDAPTLDVPRTLTDDDILRL